TWHLYYGNETGAPGTALTFFVWDHLPAGRPGVSQAVETAFAIPESSIGYWTARLVEKGVPHDAPEKRFRETLIGLRHPHRLGTLHHVAFRAAGDADQAAMADAVRRLGLRPTDQIDRRYFRSVYFREPGGVLFEIATEDPGFTLDEPKASLGTALKLPPWYEE